MSQDEPNDAIEKQLASSRRHFIKSGGMFLAGGAVVGSNAKVAQSAHVYGCDTIKLGLVGCGRRGVQAALEALNTRDPARGEAIRSCGENGGVQLVAIADVQPNRLQSSFRAINGLHSRKVKPGLARFHGTMAYQGVMESDADVVILATPPFFRPLHMQAAIHAGKHLFMERPVAVDVAGIKTVLDAGTLALRKGLAVQIGLQRRHERRYQETIARLQSGIVGDVLLARTYCNVNQPRRSQRYTDESVAEYQLRNWRDFSRLGGDLMVEQNIQNLDVINWLLGECPIEARGSGGYLASDRSFSREQSLDYQCVEFTYADGTKLISQCRRTNGCWHQVGEHVHCSGGSANVSAGKIYDLRGDLVWKSESPSTKGNGWQAQQFDFFEALRRGEPPNETVTGANSTMTAILGQMATRSIRDGRGHGNAVVRWQDVIESSC
jgi:predicted dehydrogenase